VWWLVSPQNPLKPTRGMAPFAARLAAARAVAADPRIRVLDIEARLGTRYTIDTLRALQRRYRGTRFVWLMGADNLAQMPRWQRWTQIFHSLPIAIFARSFYTLGALGGMAARRFKGARRPLREAGRLALEYPPAWIFLHVRLHPASATAIRLRGRAAWPAQHRDRRQDGRSAE